MGGLELDGDWESFLRMKDVDVSKKLGIVLEQAGETLRGEIIKGIRDQKIGGPPLKENTKEAKKKRRKGKNPGSHLKLIDQGDYFSSFVSEKKRYDEIHVGSNHPQARALELGYAPRGLPARAHVGPAVYRSRNRLSAHYMKALKEIFEIK